MPFSPIERSTAVRPPVAPVVASAANRVIPVAPVNPVAQAPAPVSIQPPGVINLVNTTRSPTEGEPVYTSVQDPLRVGGVAIREPRDYTIHHPAPEKVEDPPPPPVAKVLLDHLRSVWAASAGAIQTEQVKDVVSAQQTGSSLQAPGELAKQNVVYNASRVKKQEKI